MLPTFTRATGEVYDATDLISSMPAAQGEAFLHSLPPYLLDFNFAAVDNSTLACIGKFEYSEEGQKEKAIFDVGGDQKFEGVKKATITTFTQNADWILFAALSGEVKNVYVVETAGGKAPAACSGEVAEPFAAEAWFYG